MTASSIDLRAEAPKIVGRYPPGRGRSALLPLLSLAQRRDGYVTSAAMNEIGEILGLSGAEIRGVASFYHMLKLKPKGRRVVSVCHTIACAIGGADRVIASLEKELGINCGETTGDAAITLERAECLAACDLAPMLQVDYDHVHGPLTVESALEIVRALRDGSYVSMDQPAAPIEPGAIRIPPVPSEAREHAMDEPVMIGEPGGHSIAEADTDTAGRWPPEHREETMVEPVGRVTRPAYEEPLLVETIPLTEEEERLLRSETPRDSQ